MASAFLTVNANLPSAEPSPTLDPKVTSPKKRPVSGDFIVLKKTSNISNGKGDLNEDEGNKASHKKHGDKGKRSPIPPETKVGKENDTSKEKLTINEGLEKHAINVNESHSPKDISARDKKKEEDNQKHSDDIQSVSEESHQSHLTFDSSPALDKMQRRFDAKPTLVSKLLTETTDSQQSLSTNSPENFDEETAV